MLICTFFPFFTHAYLVNLFAEPIFSIHVKVQVQVQVQGEEEVQV
jgi:hypothetical protein